MKLKWRHGEGPETTQELADEVEREGGLIRRRLLSEKGRCLWGVIFDVEDRKTPGEEYIHRKLTRSDTVELYGAGCSPSDNDAFRGTMEERCKEMVARLRRLP